MGFAWMVAAVLASWAFNAVVQLVWRPRAITRRLHSQGVGGPDYRFFSGSFGEIKRLRAEGAGLVLDVFSRRTFLYWFGAQPTMCLADVNMVRQVLSNHTGLYRKNLTNPYFARLLGKGLVLTDSNE
ncbi:hypothetical protein E2562_013305 [Oryza meyeriana var. granulata]|uniref:Cytochrome P450 n=1 Tax=Oryza meyeriana var. granulata TaxID=110450 RepID=A0A6G1D3E0_9ORYZ|nr:hypothetical protein E2562_013305 [Oryza meyeriana var. granulata]